MPGINFMIMIGFCKLVSINSIQSHLFYTIIHYTTDYHFRYKKFTIIISILYRSSVFLNLINSKLLMTCVEIGLPGEGLELLT